MRNQIGVVICLRLNCDFSAVQEISFWAFGFEQNFEGLTQCTGILLLLAIDGGFLRFIFIFCLVCVYFLLILCGCLFTNLLIVLFFYWFWAKRVLNEFWSKWGRYTISLLRFPAQLGLSLWRFSTYTGTWWITLNLPTRDT